MAMKDFPLLWNPMVLTGNTYFGGGCPSKNPFANILEFFKDNRIHFQFGLGNGGGDFWNGTPLYIYKVKF